jgi:predicted DNA-binding transcriptional regulator YafY
MRDFRASRIQDVEVLPDGFTRQRDVEADALAEDAQTGPGFREVRVWLDGNVLPWARETPAFGFEREERGEDGSVFIFQMRELRRLMPWVLSWGPSARVLSPADVAREVRRQAEALASRYAED